MEPTKEDGEIASKRERLAEVFRRIAAVPACSTFDEAYQLLCNTMDEVEDELTTYPNEPDRWMELPRLFPPQTDRMSSVKGCDVKRFDSLRHVTYIAGNGAIKGRSLRLVEGEAKILFNKAGNDGRCLSDVCPNLKEANL